MQNDIHQAAGRNVIYPLHRLHMACSMSPLRYRKAGRINELMAKLRGIALYCLTTLAVSTILLTVTYTFLVQLASYGW